MRNAHRPLHPTTFPHRKAKALRSPVPLATALALALATACGSSAAPAPRPGTSTVGSGGGSVALPSGPRLDVPAGALPVATTLTVEPSGDTAPSGAPVYQLGPEGTTFAQPVTVTLPLPAGLSAPAVYWSKPGSTTEFDVVPATVTADGVVARNTHFSTVFVGPSSGAGVCASAGPHSDGTSCGGGLVCTAGQCGATVSGTVSGPVVAGVTVALAGTSTATATTDASGRYAFSALAVGSYTVTPSLAGYAFTPASAAVAVVDASVAGQDFAADGAYAIAGTVSGPVEAGVTVSLSGAKTASTISDASGHYAFTAIAPGRYTVAPSLAGYAFTPASAAVTVVAGSVGGEDFSGWRPDLQAVSPSEAHVGASLTLSGNLFRAAGGGGTVTVGGVVANVVSWSSTRIVATVPSGAGQGGVQVHVAGADSVVRSFTVTATVAGQLTSADALAARWAFGGDESPAQLIVAAQGTARSALSRTVDGAGYGGLPRSFSLELPVGTHTLAIQDLDGDGKATVDLLQGASRAGPTIAVGEEGVSDLTIPLRWHWEVHPLDPGFDVCGAESQLWFRDALHGLVTFRVGPGFDPGLDATDASYGHGMAMETSDGGQTWSIASRDMSAAWTDPVFLPADPGWFPNGYLLTLPDGVAISQGDNGALVRSTDFGRTWSGASMGWSSIGPAMARPTRFARAGDRLWVSITTGGAQGSMERTQLVTSTDEGRSWSTRFDVCNTSSYAPNGCGTPGVPIGFAGLDMACSDVNPQHCITMGYEHDDYTSVVMVTRDGFETWTTLAPKCGYFGDGQVLWLPGTDTAWVTSSSSCPGVNGQYVVTNDGGQTFTDWAPVPFGGKMSFADATHAAGWWSGGVWTTSDAGATWIYTGHAPAGGAGLRTVQVLDASHMWTLGHPDCRDSGVAYVARWVP